MTGENTLRDRAGRQDRPTTSASAKSPSTTARVAKALSEATVDVTVSDADQAGPPLPCRITVLNEQGR